ncbi:MAG TPA: histidine phosphatase family protein [Candidatus Elarobacter sp.]|jgi:broad specificity phosphatase PhoE|nr:histidine phosphatase family protein [Candidatus Elarobacter sp.]
MEVGWPSELFVIRHAQSAGNVARDLAMASGATVIDITGRDCDVALSELGERQARALGTWCARHLDPIDAVISSTYLRAQQTAEMALGAAGWTVPVTVDERLREKEFGSLDRLTRMGIEQRFPEQAEMRRVLGKFYYRPPGGESWCDVILRLRSLVDSLTREYAGCRVAIVTHQVIVLCFRYLLEKLTEQQLLEIDRAGDVANCAVTTYVYDDVAKTLKLRAYNVVAPMEESGEPVTTRPDVPLAR